MPERKYRWYIEPLDNYTNELIAREITEENCGKKLCNDGKERTLWDCGYDFTYKLIRSQKRSLSARFKVFVQEGNGETREWNLTNKKKRKIKK